ATRCRAYARRSCPVEANRRAIGGDAFASGIARSSRAGARSCTFGSPRRRVRNNETRARTGRTFGRRPNPALSSHGVWGEERRRRLEAPNVQTGSLPGRNAEGSLTSARIGAKVFLVFGEGP